MSESKSQPLSPKSRLELLKAKRLETKKANQRDLRQETQDLKIASINAKKDEQDFQKLDDEDKESDQRLKTLDYTIEESEKWDAKQQKHKKYQNKNGILNQDKLAESTYYKELNEFKIDKKAYEDQKTHLMNKYNVNESELKTIVDLLNNPNKQTKDEVSKLLAQFKKNKTNKRRRDKQDDLQTNGYVNEKNRQFNLKLNRQYSS